MLEGYIDDSVNPCENFYQFACGKWLENNPIPSYLQGIDGMTELFLQVSDDLQNIMENIDVSYIYGKYELLTIVKQ